jgi:hypothetical protein
VLFELIPGYYTIAYVCPNESAPTTELDALPIHEAPAEPEPPRTRRCRNTIIDSGLGERMCGREDCPGKWIRANCVTAKEQFGDVLPARLPKKRRLS